MNFEDFCNFEAFFSRICGIGFAHCWRPTVVYFCVSWSLLDSCLIGNQTTLYLYNVFEEVLKMCLIHLDVKMTKNDIWEIKGIENSSKTRTTHILKIISCRSDYMLWSIPFQLEALESLNVILYKNVQGKIMSRLYCSSDWNFKAFVSV